MRSLFIAVLKTGSGAVVNLLLGVVSIKIMAVMLGPSGTGLFSLIRQAITTLSSLGFGGQTALVQGAANKQGKRRDSYLRTTFWLFAGGGLLSAMLIELFAPRLCTLVFGSADARTIQLIRLFALPVILLHAHIYLKSVINGCRAIGRLALVEILGPLITLLATYPVCVFVGEGYALAFVWMLSAAYAVMIIASGLILYKNGWIPSLFMGAEGLVQSADFHYFISIAGITFLTGMISSGTLLAVRTMVARDGGLHQAGLFDLAWSLSGSYVMLLLSSFGTYYTPTLSQAVDSTERAALVRRVIRLSTMLMIPMIVTMIVIKPLLVKALYSNEYIASLELVRWMLIGDYLKITSWVLATAVVVNLDMKIYFWTETFWYVGFLALSALAIFYFRDLQGIGVAFIGLYAALVYYYLQYVRRVYKMKLSSDLLIPWLIGLATVLIASIQNWYSTAADWFSSLLWIAGSTTLTLMFLKQSERRMIWDKIWFKLRN